MKWAFLKFDTLPKIGFAHHFCAENYSYTYGSDKKSFEVVYVVSGDIIAELYGEEILIKQGSVFLLFRNLPIVLKSAGKCAQAHCTVQAEVDFELELIEDKMEIKNEGILLPFVVEPGSESEKIKTMLYSIVTEIAADRERNLFSASLSFVAILKSLNSYARKKFEEGSAKSIISYRIKKFIAKRMEERITLSDIAEEVARTPNYINSVFKKVNGITINQYIASEKIKRVVELMQVQKLPFKTACENSAIHDLSYGYRLFKKHMGITPGEFSEGSKIEK